MTPLDNLRKKLFYQDYHVLKYTLDSRNPFLSVTALNAEDSVFLYDFLKPPTRQTFLTDRRKKNAKGEPKQKKYAPHTLIFIVDGLKKLSDAQMLLANKTQIEQQGNLHSEFARLCQLAKVAVPFFEKLSEKAPTLSFTKFLAALRQQSSWLDADESNRQVIKAIRGILTNHPIYSTFIQPLIEYPSEEKRDALLKHHIIQSIVWNTYLIDRYHLSSHQTVEQALRAIQDVELKPLKGFNEIESHNDLIKMLERGKNEKFKPIIHFIKRANKDFLNGITQNSRRLADQEKKTRNHYHWIETTSQRQVLEVGGKDEGLLILRTRRAIDWEATEDLADDELIDDDYILEIDRDKTAIPEAKVINLANKLQHIENFNQYLKDELTPSEIDTILTYAGKKSQQKSTSESELRALTLICISLTCGYNLEQTDYLRWLKVNPKKSSTIPCLSENCDYLHLPIPTYQYLTIDNDALYYEAKASITLPIPPRMQAILIACLESYYKKSKCSSDPIDQNNKPNPLRKSIEKTLEKIGLDRRITLGLIQNHVPLQALRYANGDLWTVSLLSGREDIMSSTHKHYTTTDMQRVYQTYQKVILQMYQTRVVTPQKDNPKAFQAIGNPLRPKKNEIVNWLNRVSDYLMTIVNNDPGHVDTSTLVPAMNLLTGYFETFLSFFIASRNTTNPYLYLNQILPNGFVTVNDKNINNGYNTHWVYVPSKLRDLQRYYENWMWSAYRTLGARKQLRIEDLFTKKLDTVHKWKTLEKTNDRFPGFVLCNLNVRSEKGRRFKVTLQKYTRGNLHEILKDQTLVQASPLSDYVRNINRHFLRSSLLERGLNPEYLDEYMGHRHRGTESWNAKCLFNPLDYQNSVKQALENIMKDFKVRIPFQDKP